MTDRWIADANDYVAEMRAKDPQHYRPTYVLVDGEPKTVLYVGNPEAIVYDVTRPHPDQGYPSLQTAMARINLFVNRIKRHLSKKELARYTKARKILRSLYKEKKGGAREGGDLQPMKRRALLKDIPADFIHAMDEQQQRREESEPRGRGTADIRVAAGRQGGCAKDPSQRGWSTPLGRELRFFGKAVQVSGYGPRAQLVPVDLGILDVVLTTPTAIRQPGIYAVHDDGVFQLASTVEELRFLEDRGTIRDLCLAQAPPATTGSFFGTGVAESPVDLHHDVMVHPLDGGLYVVRLAGRATHTVPVGWADALAMAADLVASGQARQGWVRFADGGAQPI